MNKNVIGLIRVSTNLQSEENGGTSLEFQKNKLEQYAVLNDMKLSKVICDIASGGLEDREGVLELENDIKNGEVDTIDHTEMIDEIEDYLAHGSKINAIKYYREEMKVRFGDQVSLRKSKDFVDDIHEDLKRKGICK